MTHYSTLFMALLFSLIHLSVPAFASDEEMPLVYFLGADLDIADSNEGTLVTWDADAWVGGDVNRLRFESEGELLNGDEEEVTATVLYSRNIARFWDLQVGFQQEIEPHSISYAVIGIEGLAPLFFETEARLLIDEEGHVGAQLEQSYDILLSQRFIVRAHGEIAASFQKVEARELGSGFTHVEVGLQSRYELSRKFAPYIDLVYASFLNDTKKRRKALGHETEEVTLRFGLKVWH